MSKQILTREQKAQELASNEGSIILTAQNTYRVKSQTSKTFYHVTDSELGWRCTCPDHEFRGVRCKHILAVEIRFELRKEVEVAGLNLLLMFHSVSIVNALKLSKMELDVTNMAIFRDFNVSVAENTLQLT